MRFDLRIPTATLDVELDVDVDVDAAGLGCFPGVTESSDGSILVSTGVSEGVLACLER